MEATREIYWNVGDGVIIPMYFVVMIAGAMLIQGLLKRMKVYGLGKPLKRFDNPGKRISGFLKGVFLQSKVRDGRLPGTAHAIFFWSFILLTIGTTLVFIQVDITGPLFGWNFLKGGFYKIFSLTLDIAGLAAIITMAGLFIRRYLLRPEGLETSAEDFIMHSLLFAVLATGFLVEGLRMAATELKTDIALAYYSPVGMVVGKLFSGASDESLRNMHLYSWWVHLFIVAAFFISVPLTKFRHMFTTSANYIFTDLRRKGSIDSLDLEDESVETYGVSVVKEFKWKDIFDADACTLCKRCQDECPAWATGKPLSPMKVINQIGETAFKKPNANLIETVTKEALWACTTCRACQEVCPASIEHVNKILEMRRQMVLMEGEFPGDEVKTAVDATEVNGNPLGMPFASRGDWAEGLGLAKPDEKPDLLYFAGCYASFDRRNIQVAKSFIKVCKAAGLSIGILGKEEKCCGEPVRKLGNEYLYQTLANENIEKIKASGAKKIVTTCPHCFNTLDRDYRDLGLDIEVEHHATFLNRLIGDGRLKVREEAFDCTYHDSCYIGRYNDIYGEPRDLIKAAGGGITEMEQNFCKSFCCGGGGGRVIAEEKLGTRISGARVKMAEKTGAKSLVSNCPFCLTMFEDGLKAEGLDEKISARDIAEILAERI